jgi:hypothetical protein
MSEQYMASQDLSWRKSSHSANNGACVEIAVIGGRVTIRDSMNPNDAELTFPIGAWRVFVADRKERA